ncbi:hypothetical protein BLA32_05375 (plasmid) [Borreliella afzelii]|uniref:Uncharacterized protein n=1 Tax=Borreliella afzelii TaxID=29518 RepID=A0A1L4DGK4_BORAF|nr:hypothetical protein BLA32_05375 [Borreliella afzelii]
MAPTLTTKTKTLTMKVKKLIYFSRKNKLLTMKVKKLKIGSKSLQTRLVKINIYNYNNNINIINFCKLKKEA